MVARARKAFVLALASLCLVATPAGAAAPKRIVALTPFTANTLAALGVKPVGVGQTLGGRERLNSRLKGVRTLPMSHPAGPNLEQLASLNPQLVFNSPTFKKGSAGMRSLKIKVVESDPHDIAESVAQTRRIARLVGKRKQGDRLALKLLKGVARARGRIRDRPTVLLILGVGRTPFAFLPNSWGGDVVRNAGGTLLTAGRRDGGGFARISDEVVVAEDPDVIIAVPHAAARDIPSIAKYLRSNPAWSTTTAVRTRRVYVSTDNSLLQAGTDAGTVIRAVRKKYLKN
jgi:iron complex transport system substrate-binding protein